MEDPLAILPPLLLASASPRRRDLLARARVPFDVLPAGIDEASAPGEAPVRVAARLAREKALTVAACQPERPRRLVLGADTIVVLGGEILGKPESPEHAVALLERLVGRWHEVLTGIALVDTGRRTVAERVVTSRVLMRPASKDELRRYVATGEPLDKAGAYAAQGEGRGLIVRIEGSETNVIGLPLVETLDALRGAGFPLEDAA